MNHIRILDRAIVMIIIVVFFPLTSGATQLPIHSLVISEPNGEDAWTPIQTYENSNVSKVCWVDFFDNTETTNWIFTGSTPFLHNDTDSYITSLGTSNCSWFHFQNVSLAALQKVFLIIEWKARQILSGGEAKLFLDNGISQDDLGPFNLTLEYDWTEIDVTSNLKTISQVNTAKMKIVSIQSGLYLVAVRRAYLRIYNGPVPLQTCTKVYGKAGGPLTLALKWGDPDGLSSYSLNHNASGSWLLQNLTGIMTGIESWSNYTITLPTNAMSVLAYRFWANDTYNNWEKTSVLHVYPVKNFSPELLQIVESATGFPLSHSYGRKDYYDSLTGRFWKFYSNGSYMKYTSTTDGEFWIEPQIVRPAVRGFMFYIHVFNGTVNYVYNSEGTGEDVYYRMGALSSDGVITWVTSEQIVLDGGSLQRFYPCSIVTDGEGYPYIVFGNRTNPDLKTLNIAKSNYSNGTWLMAAGFPKQINESPDDDLVSGVALSLPSNGIYVIYCSAGNQEPPRGCLWQDSVLGALQNASDYTMTSNYQFSAVADEYGNVHIVYRRNSERADYSFFNYTTGSWQVKDELVTSHLTVEILGSSSYSWPIIGWNPALEAVYVHWWTLEDKSAWIRTRNSTGWKPRRRIIRLDDDFTLIDGDVTTPESYQSQILLNFVAQDVTSGQKEVWAYVYTNRPPIAVFTESAETVYTGEIIVFNASGSEDSDGIILDYCWDFDDATNSTGEVVEHAYLDNGNYTVILTVTDDDGATSSSSSSKLILNRPPLANFTKSAETAYPTELVVFNATDSYDPDGTVVTYFWDFGDNNTAIGRLVEHAYATEGIYIITLTVVDDDGATSNATSTIVILRRDVAVLSAVASVKLLGTEFFVAINVTVENQGYYTETFNMTTHANTTIIQTQTVMLESGYSTNLTALWNTTSFAKGNYTISVTLTQVPGETDTADNLLVNGWAFVTIPGDADEDRDVDIFDIVKIALAYGSQLGEPEYTTSCDIDCDGDVDIFDIVIAARNYGNSW